MTSGPDDAPIDRKRASPRLNQHDREAAVRRGNAQARIRVLNLSQSGIMAESTVQLSPGERIDIVLDNSDPLPATLLWVEGRRFGAEFVVALPFAALLPPTAGRHAPQAARPATDRIVVDAAAVVRHAGVATPACIRNVSVRGMLIETAARLQRGQIIEIETNGWPAVGASVIWNRNGTAGLRLKKPLTEEQMLDLKLARASAG